MTAAALNHWRTIRKARREKRIRMSELARKTREIGARAIIGYANAEERYNLTGYGPHARGEKHAKWREKIYRKSPGWGLFV